jgi:hypothetical protein
MTNNKIKLHFGKKKNNNKNFSFCNAMIFFSVGFPLTFTINYYNQNSYFFEISTINSTKQFFNYGLEFYTEKIN